MFFLNFASLNSSGSRDRWCGDCRSTIVIVENSSRRVSGSPSPNCFLYPVNRRLRLHSYVGLTSRTQNKRDRLATVHISTPRQFIFKMHPPTYTLNTGAKIPAIGLGTWNSKKDEVVKVLEFVITQE